MSVLTYQPSPELGEVKVGDMVSTHDSQGFLMEMVRVTKVAKRYIKTECGRQWTVDYGEWIACFHGNKPESYPFPSIRKV